MEDARLNAVYHAASYLFVQKGFDHTQVSEIAKMSNIATGTVYNLFAGKKALVHFVLLATMDKEYLKHDIVTPVKEVNHEILASHLNRIVEGLFSQISVKDARGNPAISLMDLLSKVYDYASDYQVAFNIINENKEVLPELEAIYRSYVNNLYELLKNNLNYYIEVKEVRDIEMPELHIRNILEGITWWAMYLPYQNISQKVSEEKAKEIAMDTLKHTYLVNPS